MSNLKILHVLSSPAAGGAEVFVKDMVINSKESGIDAGVLFISDADNVGRSSAYQEQFLAELEQNNIPFFILPKNARRNIFQGYSAFKACIKSFRPHYIHAHLLAGIIYSFFFCPSIPRVYTHHSSVIKTRPFIFKAIMKRCNAHIGISNICAQFLQQYLPKQKSCTVIHNALDKKRLCTPKNNNLTDEPLTLIAVGRISREKNYLHMLKAVVKVKKVFTAPFYLKIAGEGKETDKKQLREYINTHNLSDTVELLGNRSDVPNLLAQSDIFLMSSAWEGLPIALLEAQFSGLPALVTDVGGCKELLDITEGGIVVPVNNVDKYADTLLSLLSNSQLRDKLRSAAQLNMNDFSIEACLQKHKALYEKQNISHYEN